MSSSGAAAGSTLGTVGVGTLGVTNVKAELGKRNIAALDVSNG